jgi:hypothetical protein
MVRKARNHDDFLRLIGWDANSVGTTKVETPKLPMHSFDGDVRESHNGIVDWSPITSIRIRYPGKAVKRSDVFGGYTDGKTILLMYRFYSDAQRRHPHCSLLVLEGKTIRARCFQENEAIGAADWKAFTRIPDGAAFMIRGKQWTKISSSYLKKRLARRVFGIVY